MLIVRYECRCMLYPKHFSAVVDAGGNRKLPEIGPFLKKTIAEYV